MTSSSSAWAVAEQKTQVMKIQGKICCRSMIKMSALKSSEKCESKSFWSSLWPSRVNSLVVFNVNVCLCLTQTNIPKPKPIPSRCLTNSSCPSGSTPCKDLTCLPTDLHCNGKIDCKYVNHMQYALHTVYQPYALHTVSTKPSYSLIF